MDTASEPFYVNKWVTFAVSAILQLNAGLCYTFGVFSADMKEAFAWSQSDLQGFGTALNLGAFSAFIPGTLYSVLNHWFDAGPRLCLLIAAFEGAAGMGLVWASMNEVVHISYPALLVAGFCFSNANAFMDVVSVTCNVSNWPNDRGSAVGVMKAAVGLSGSVYSTVYVALNLDTDSYMLFCTFTPALAALLALPWVNQVPWIQKCELMPYGLLSTGSRFFLSYQVLFLLAGFTTLASLFLENDPRSSSCVLIVAVLALLIASILLVALYSGGLRSRQAHVHVVPQLLDEPPSVRRPPVSVRSYAIGLDEMRAMFRAEAGLSLDPARAGVVRTYEVDDTNSADLEDLYPEGLARLAEEQGALNVSGISSRGPGLSRSSALSGRTVSSVASELYHEQPVTDCTPWQAAATPEFALLVYASFVTMGAALAFLNNMAQLLPALAPLDHRGAPIVPASLPQGLLVAFSVCNTLGRIILGWGSEHALHQHGTPRTLFCIVMAVVTIGWTAATAGLIDRAGQGWVLFALYPVAAAAGISMGGFWTLMSCTTSEIFGLKYFAANYALVQIAPMAASFVFPNWILGRLYDAAAHAQHPHATSDNVPCHGAVCFKKGFEIITALAVLLIAAMALWRRTRWIYTREAAHLKDLEDAVVEEGSCYDLDPSDSQQHLLP